MALKTMPNGGVFLIGGVTNGLLEHLKSKDTFMKSFNDKGRLSSTVEKFQVNVVNPDLEVGLLGAEEKARREMIKTLN